jgi:hypothetical protein
MRSHLVEVMDVEGLPGSLRMALRDILETCNSRPYRSYYDWLVAEILAVAAAERVTNIVELGAGTAPLTRRLARASLPAGMRLTVADLNPDRAVYEDLERRFPSLVTPVYEPVDFGVPRQWPAGTLLVLSATFHHLPHEVRLRVLRALEESKTPYVIAEALKHNAASFAGCLLGWLAGITAPLFMLQRPGRARRLFWCWLVPVAPIAFMWDGLVSAWRCWSRAEWEDVVRALGGDDQRGFRFEDGGPFALAVIRTRSGGATAKPAH